jgi:GNAT superfamily N-acetyltransferase
LRAARPSDAESILDLLHTHMKPSWTRERWARIFDQRWIEPGAPPPFLGSVAEDEDGAIVGYCGVVCADRSIDGQRVRTGSITSLYLHRSARGQGLGRALMVEASAHPDLSYTVIGTGAGSRPLMEPAGYDLLDRDRFVWRRDGKGLPSSVRIETETQAILDRCDANVGRILTDHAGLEITPVWLETPDGAGFAVFWRQIQGEGETYIHAVHVGNGPLFAHYGQAVASALLPAEGPGTLAIDRRYLPPDTTGPTEDYGDVNFWKSPVLRRWQVDLLYTEILLLRLKLA